MSHQLNILSRLPKSVGDETLAAAIALETAIVNHCRANLVGCSPDSAALLSQAESISLARLRVISELL